MTYLITFTCHGCHLHGVESGSVDREHNVPGTPALEEDPARVTFEQRQLDQPPCHLDPVRRDAVLAAIREVCTHRGWSLLAGHVRTNHVHTVVSAEAPPEHVMGNFKAYASRRLNEMGLDGPDVKRRARHGSTRWLWNDHHVAAAVQYVVERQGEALSVFDGERE